MTEIECEEIVSRLSTGRIIVRWLAVDKFGDGFQFHIRKEKPLITDKTVAIKRIAIDFMEGEGL